MPPVAFDVLSEERLRNVVDVLVRLVEAAADTVEQHRTPSEQP